MGANQSSNGVEGDAGGASKNDPADMKTCYYQLLGVDRQATDDE